MKEEYSSDQEDSPGSRAPLISIGLAIGVVLLVPVFLYSVGPEGPIRVGDVVFSTDRHRVPFLHPLGQGRDTCIVESRVRLVVQKTDVLPHNTMIAEVIGVENAGLPFCPPRTPVRLHNGQVTLKADLAGRLGDALSQMFSR